MCLKCNFVAIKETNLVSFAYILLCHNVYQLLQSSSYCHLYGFVVERTDSGMPQRNLWLQSLPVEWWRRASRTEYKHITVAQCYNTINLDVPICPAKSPNKVLADLRSAEADQRKLSAWKSDSKVLSALWFLLSKRFWCLMNKLGLSFSVGGNYWAILF